MSGGDQRVGLILDASLDPSGVLNGIKAMQNGFNGLRIDPKLMSGLTKEFEKVNTLITKYQSQLAKGVNTKADAKNLAKTGSEIQASLDNIVKGIQEVNSTSISLKVEDATKLKSLEDNLKNIKKQIQDTFQQKIDSSGLSGALSKFAAGTGRAKSVQNLVNKAEVALERQELEKFGNTLDEIKGKLNGYKGTTLVSIGKALGLDDLSSTDVQGSITRITDRIDELKGKATEAGKAIQDLKGQETEAAKAIDSFKPGAIERGKQVTDDLLNSAEKLPAAFSKTKDAADNAASGILSAKTQVEQLQQSTQYFFSLRNMLNLLKRGIDEAVQSVKELDKAMTDTAVVTDFSVGDMWKDLPKYTQLANELGATTKGAYETMTLYYQQGLNQQQAFALGAETMKMARIAGLDYAETTDMMTAALRGFNMELDETSAKRVNDVYSKLAAITASDTEELGTAMQRTASIAASAGASFEGTTAFLAQAIETTREPAENIGTAMKTIVARFQEMKKNPLEISEVDGEEVDYNKIDAALKTIGVDLKDTNGQFRDFDQVMLDISAKWDTLSQSQQRYIATTAAGSRQQSRFIAMVSDYDRTMQLMEAANNSAGASEEQFGKTAESLEFKLNKLHNAWELFTMGIANNTIIKGAVDGLTGFLKITNKIIDTLSLGSGALKSFLSVFAAFTGLKIAGRGANALIGGLGGLVDPKSSIKEGLKIGLVGQGKNAAQAKAITTPIVGSLSKISGQIAAIAKRQGIKDAGQKGSTAGVKQTSKEDYANTKRLFSQLSGKEGFKMGDAASLFGKLDAKHQLSMFNNSPGTKAAMKKASMAWFNSKGLSKELTKEGQLYINSIYKGMKEGQIPVDKGVELIGQPQKWGKYFGTETALAYSKSFIQESKPAMEASRQTAHEVAIASLGFNPEDYKVGSKELKGLLNDKNNEQIKKEYAALYSGFRGDLDSFEGHGGAKGKVSDLGRLANDIGAVGDKFTQAGYGITTFGNALSQLGGPIGAIGSGIAAFGGAVSSMGMMVSGATSLITVFSEGIQIAGTSIAISGGAIAAVVGPLAAAAAAFLLVRAHLKKVKEAGEEVTNTFKETSKSAEDNVAKLKSYQSEFAQLSKGVDSNGYNVSLDDSQYQRYLEIVDDIAAINPDIVEGYNAQGHAIINNNKALEETLKKQQQIKDEAYDTYTSEESLQKLINARNINNDFKAINIKGESPSVYDGSGHGSEGRQKPVGLGRDVFNIVDQLRLNKDFDESSLQKYGIDSLNSLINGEEQAVKNFIKHRKQIEADLSNSGLKLNDSILKGFDKLGEDAAAFDEAIKPVYDNLLASVSNSKVFESIAPEFREALNMGLKDLASQDLSAGEMSKAANNMAAKFANLTTGSGKYKDALEIVEQAQSNFANTLNETEYRADVEPAIQDLIKLKEEALDEGTAYGDALAEYLENQIQRISNFTSEGGANLTEALNTATDEIAAAEGALDSFNEATKKDFSTAAEGMKGIFDKTTETFKDSYGTEIQKHAEGMGDATFWTGAEALLSGKEIEKLTSGKNGYDAAEAVAKKIKDLEPMLREGQEGFDAFTDRVLANADAMDKLAEAGVTYDKESGLITNIPDDQWHNVAEALGISDDLLTSMLNKGRQFADISFMNIDEARKALAASDFTIKGTSAGPGEQQNLYVKEDTLRTQLSEAGYVRREQQDEQIAKLLNEGVKTIPADATQLSSKELDAMAKDWGISTLPDLIQTLNETGDFTKDEIKNYADQMGLLGSDAQYDSLYSDIIEAAENPELVKQTGVLETISAQIAAMAVSDDASQGKTQKELNKTNEEMLGGKGVDTDAQAFAYGKKLVKDENGNIIRDKNGNVKLERLTAGEYEETKKSMQAVADSYRETAAIAAAKAKVATGEDKKYWEGVQKNAEEGATRADKYMQMADKAMQKQEDLDKKEVEGRQKEIDARNKAREEEQKQRDAEIAKKNKEEQAARDLINKDRKEPRKLTDADENKARQEGKEAERKAKEEEGRKKEIEARNKSKEVERKQEEALRNKETEGRKREIDARNKARENAQKQEEVLRQKEAQGRQQEIDARNKAREEEQARLMTEQHEKRGDQQESYWRERGKQENQVAQVADIQNKADYLLRTSINTSLKTALDNLDPTQIASDPAQSQAFSNLYADLINNRLPKAEDLQTLGIFTQLDSQYQDQINGVTEKASVLGEKLASAYKAFAETDKAALAMDVTPGADNIEKAISSIKERLKSWQNKINNTSVDTSVNAPKVASNISSGANAVAKIAQTATEQVQSKVTVDTSDGEAKLSNLKTKTEEVASTIQQGATFAVKVNDNGLKNAAKRAETITKASGSKNISVTASGTEDTNKLSAAVKGFAKLSNKAVSLTARASGLSGVQSLTSAVQAFHRLSNKTIRLTTIKETINKQAVGSHNHGYASSLPNMGSLARGSYGQIGPKGKGGLTLTGELGYEIAWLPDENRSMILGADGPQMVNLPGNAVVWTHEQSKKILKQKSIPAGSHASEMASNYKKKYITSSLSSSSGSSNSSGSKSGGSKKGSSNSSTSSSSNTNNDTTNHFSIEEVIRFDYDKTLETLASKIKKTTDQIEKNLNKIGVTAKDVAGIIQDQMKNLEATKKFNERLIASYQKDLDALDKNKYMMTVSYNAGSGKNKDSKDYTFDAQWYVYQSTDGQYQINENAIKKLGNKELEEAVFKAVEGVLNPLASGLLKAQDAAYEAQKQIDELNKKLVETFYMWKNEITEVYALTQRINAEAAKTDRLSSQVSLELAKLNTGFGDTAESIAIMVKANKRNNDSLIKQIQLQNDLIKADESQLSKIVTAEEETTRINTFREMGVGKGKGQFATQAEKDEAIKQAEDERDIATLAMKYVTISKKSDGTIDYNIDWKQFELDRLTDPITAKSAEEVKKRLDSIGELNSKVNEDIQKQTELTNSLFEQLKHYQELMTDFESTILSQLDEQLQKEIDNAEKLGSIISDSLKDLLSEVKRKLDERRRQEDNTKTERDISQKQQRLAALRANTSGGNQVEIAQLEKEIADSQQSYQRTLEDQLLDKLQQQGDEAAQQRERQIEIAQAHLEFVKDKNKEEVAKWLQNPAAFKDQLQSLYLESQDYDSKGLLAQEQLRNESESKLAELVVAANEIVRSTEGLTGNKEYITTLDAIENIAGTNGNKTKKDADFQKQIISYLSNYADKLGGSNGSLLRDITNRNTEDYETMSIIDTLLFGLENADNYDKKIEKIIMAEAKARDARGQSRNPNVISKETVKDWYNGSITVQEAAEAGANIMDLMRIYAKKKGYKKGGLADFTGPAWLDGTPSKPELVLNATDTKNFLALRDVLSNAMKSTSTVSNSYGGDVMYEINVNVDHLNNDYDVDKVVERVKKEIAKGAGYRNVTQVRNFR